MKKISTFIFLLFVCSAFSQTDSTAVFAQIAYDEQDYALALELFNDCIKKDSTIILHYEKGGLAAYRLGDTPKAKSLFLELIKRDSINKLGLTQLAGLYEQEKNTPKAIKYYTSLVKLYESNAVFYRKLAQQYQSAGLNTEAFKYYTEAFKRNPRDMFSIKGISELFLLNKQYQEADSILRLGLRMDTLNINFHQLLATSKYRQKSYDSTVYYLARIKGKVDLKPYFNKMIGYSLIQIDSFNKAIPYLFKSLTDHGDNENSHYYLATAYQKLDSVEYAKHHFDKAIEESISSNVDLYHRNLAKIYNQENKLKKAIYHYKDAFKYGKDPLMLFYLARASDMYYKDKNIAVRYYDRFIKSDYDHEEYIKYSKQRTRYLKEQQHQTKTQNE